MILDSLRSRVNTQAGSKGGIGGVLLFWYGFADQVVDWQIALAFSQDHLQAFITGTIAAFLGVGTIAARNRDLPSPREIEPEIQAPVVVRQPEPVIISDPVDRYEKPVAADRPIRPNAIDMQQLRAELKRDEGFRDHIYLDSLGHLTAGYGHLLEPDDPEYGSEAGTKISKARIDEWFNQDITTAIVDARVVVNDFDSHPKAVKHALVNMAFNLGRERLSKFVNTLALINQRRYEEAAAEALNSRWADQVGVRSKRVAAMIASAEPDYVLA